MKTPLVLVLQSKSKHGSPSTPTELAAHIETISVTGDTISYLINYNLHILIDTDTY